MQESDYNRIIKNSIIDNEKNFGFKIPDNGLNRSIKKPYDLYGIKKSGLINIESKLMKKQIKAFNFNRIEEHQLYNLNLIEDLTIGWIPKPLNLISVGIFIPRTFYRALFFDIKFITQEIKKGKKSFLKKELEKFIQNNQYLTIKKNGNDYLINSEEMNRLKEVVIYNYE